MKPEAQQSFYRLRDVQEQPEAEFVLMTSAGSFNVDNLVTVDGTMSGVLERDGQRIIVITFPERTAWTLISRSYLEAFTQAEAVEAYLEALPGNMKNLVRVKRVKDAYKEDLGDSQNPEDIFRRMMGGGEGGAL